MASRVLGNLKFRPRKNQVFVSWVSCFELLHSVEQKMPGTFEGNPLRVRVDDIYTWLEIDESTSSAVPDLIGFSSIVSTHKSDSASTSLLPAK
jgi:hypothetical protein